MTSALANNLAFAFTCLLLHLTFLYRQGRGDCLRSKSLAHLSTGLLQTLLIHGALAMAGWVLMTLSWPGDKASALLAVTLVSPLYCALCSLPPFNERFPLTLERSQTTLGLIPLLAAQGVGSYGFHLWLKPFPSQGGVLILLALAWGWSILQCGFAAYFDRTFQRVFALSLATFGLSWPMLYQVGPRFERQIFFCQCLWFVLATLICLGMHPWLMSQRSSSKALTQRSGY